MFGNIGWTSRQNREISFEEGLAMIDNFYDGPAHSDALRAPDTDTTIAAAIDLARTADHAREADDVRTAAAITQLSHSAVAPPSKDPPILPSSPPWEHQPQLQRHWTHNRPLDFTSSPVTFSNAPPQTPTPGLPMAAGPTPFAVASHIKSMPSTLQSKAPLPNIIPSKNNSPASTSPKDSSPVFSVSNIASPALTTSKAGSPAPTDTPTSTLTPAAPWINKAPVLTPIVPRANIPPIPPASLPKTNVPLVPSPTATKTNKKENVPVSNKVAKKHANDSPTASTPTASASATSTPTATRAMKKSRCMRCVKQHGACNLDTRHPCYRCARAGLSAADCIPREYKAKRKS